MVMCGFNYVVYLNFSNEIYKVHEDDGFLCINLTLNEPAPSNAIVRVNDLIDHGNAKSKLCLQCS